MIDRMLSRTCVLLALLAHLPIASPLLAQDATSAINIGSRRELFVDRYLLDSLEGTRLKLHLPQPAEIVLKVDHPWEGTTGYGLSVIQDGDTYPHVLPGPVIPIRRRDSDPLHHRRG